VRGIEHPPLTPIENAATPEQTARGAVLFGQRCSMCHGINAVSGGSIAHLRYVAPATLDALDSIVRQSAYISSAGAQLPPPTDAQPVPSGAPPIGPAPGFNAALGRRRLQ
jgi:mono/diheme cytochrome c family protein